MSRTLINALCQEELEISELKKMKGEKFCVQKTQKVQMKSTFFKELKKPSHIMLAQEVPKNLSTLLQLSYIRTNTALLLILKIVGIY